MDATVPLTADDAIWTIVGLGDAEQETNMAENVDEHLLEAYRVDISHAT